MNLIIEHKPYNLPEYLWIHILIIIAFFFGIYWLIDMVIKYKHGYIDFLSDLLGPIVSISLLIILPPIYLYYGYNYNNEKKVHTSIIAIKDKVKIEGDKLTIEPLPDKHTYLNNYLSSNESHDFKIVKDTFYSDSDVKLVDKRGKEYYIQKPEFEELLKK